MQTPWALKGWLEELARDPNSGMELETEADYRKGNRASPPAPILRPEDPRQVWVKDEEGTGTFISAFYLKES